MTLNRLLKLLLNVKGATVNHVQCSETKNSGLGLTVGVRPSKKDRWRCPVCGKKCHVHDYPGNPSRWRGMNLGPVGVSLEASVPRIECPEHGVLAAAVPWAKKGSRFTTDFAYSAAWMLKCGLNRSRIAEHLRIDWDTVGRLADLVWHELEPDPGRRFDGLVHIGIDETSYKKGHNYITVVVNHDTNTVVWAHEAHGKAVLDLFFGQLSPEQRASIRVVTGDGAKWITESILDFCPNADRCVDPFHVVEWANDALDSIRLDAWRRARITLADTLSKLRAAEKSNHQGLDDLRMQADEAKKTVDNLKNSKYALGKNASNLTERQRERLAMIQAEDGVLARGYLLRERLKAVFKLTDPVVAEEYLDKWGRSAQRCRIPVFVELQRKIRRHRTHILNTVRYGLSNARIEATNNKIKLLQRIAYGFRNIDTMISLTMLFCSYMEIPWPSTRSPMCINTGRNADKAA